jgi:hypothetical protein
MTTSRLITRSACALGAAMLATTALHGAPAQARGHSGGHIGSSAHITTHKGFLTTHKGFRIAKETTGQHGPVSGGRKQLGGGGIFTKPNGMSEGSGARPIPPGSRPPFDPGHIQFDPNSGGSKTPPILSGTATPSPIPPASRPTSTGNLPGSKPPVIIITNPPPIPPVVGNPTRTPTPPTTGPINPGNYPGGGPINPDYPGGSRPPILTGTPTPVPVPIPTGSSPGYGSGPTYTHQYGQVGVYADIGAGGDSYEPCQWFKSNYDRTGNIYWFRRYRICLWQH